MSTEANTFISGILSGLVIAVLLWFLWMHTACRDISGVVNFIGAISNDPQVHQLATGNYSVCQTPIQAPQIHLNT